MSAVRAATANPAKTDGLSNSIKSENGKYQIQWVISDFSQQKDEFHSPVFTQTSVKIVLELKFINDKGVLIINFLQFPGFKVNYEVELCNSKVETKKGERTFLFEEEKRKDTWSLGIARTDLTEEEGWLANGALVVKICVYQPPSHKRLLDSNSLKRLTAPVSFVNGVYSFQWRLDVSEFGDADLTSREFRCGELRLVASISESELSFKFEVKREVDVTLKAIFANSLNDMSRQVDVQGIVTPKEPKLDVTMPCTICDLAGQPGFVVDGVMTIEFQMTCKFLTPTAGPTSDRISMMLSVGTLEKPQTNVLHVPLPSPIRADLGFVGLCNMGSTCYMTSLLQVLFHIPYLRRFVYGLNTENVNHPVVSELQKLFALMQFGSKTCSMLEFLKSFGWLESEMQAQRDIEDVAIDLFGRIRAIDEQIDEIVAGREVECVSSEDEKRTESKFYKLSLEVVETGTLEKALEKYFSDLKRQIIELPPVLFFHLNRFKTKQGSMKVNDRFEFPDVIDMSQYVHGENPDEYRLYAVVVHSGKAEGGHYFAFLNVSMENQWVKFNDTIVKPVERRQAVDDNFGGVLEFCHLPKIYSAYVLVYVRRSMIGELFEPVKSEQVPVELRDYVEQIAARELQKQSETQRKAQSVTIRLLTEDEIRDAVLEGRWPTTDACEEVVLPKTTPLSELYDRFGGQDVRLWTLVQLNLSPHKIIPNDQSTTLRALVGNFSMNSVRILVQRRKPTESIDIGVNQIMIFAAFFFKDAEVQLQYVGSINVGRYDTVDTMFPKVAGLIGSSSCEMVVYKDVGRRSSIPLKPNETLASQFVDNGNFLVFEFQKTAADQTYTYDAASFKPPSRPSRVEDDGKIFRYADFFGRIRVESVCNYSFEPDAQYEIASFEKPLVLAGIVEIPSNLPIIELKRLIATALQLDYDPEKDSMIIYRMDPLTRNPSPSVLDSLARHAGPKPDRIFYSILRGSSEEEVARGIQFRVQYSPDAYNVTYVRVVYADRNATCGFLFNQFKKTVPSVHFGDGQYRFMMVSGKGDVEFMRESDEFRHNRCDLRIEPVPFHQQELGPDDVLVPVNKDRVKDRLVNAHDDPNVLHSWFYVVVKRGETFAETKARIRAAMDNEPAFDGFLFAMKSGSQNHESPLNDRTVMKMKELDMSCQIVLSEQFVRPPHP